jgi:hypothetical protein
MLVAHHRRRSLGTAPFDAFAVSITIIRRPVIVFVIVVVVIIPKGRPETETEDVFQLDGRHRHGGQDRLGTHNNIVFNGIPIVIPPVTTTILRTVTMVVRIAGTGGGNT